MSLLSSSIDWLNGAQPIASAILDGVVAVGWGIAISVSFIATTLF